MPDQLTYSVEAEEAVLGAMLLDSTLVKIIDLSPDEFYIERHGEIYRAMQSVDADGKGIDFLTVSEKLKDENKLDMVGGMVAVSGMVNSAPVMMNAGHYAKIVRDRSNRRKAIQVANEIVKSATQDAEYISGKHIIALMETERGKGQISHISGALSSLDDWLVERVEMRESGTMDRLPKTHIDGLDEILLFLEPGQITIIAGEPGVGKTTLMQQIIESNHHVVRLIESLEMSAYRLAARMVSGASGVPVSSMRRGLPGDKDGVLLNKVRASYARFEKEGIYINCGAGMTCEIIYSDIAKLKATGHDVKLVAIDYFGLIQDSSPAENRTAREENISEKILRMSKELDVHILVIDSYNKAGFGHTKGSMARITGAARKGYNADNIITLTMGEYTIAGQQVFADLVKVRDGEVSSARINLMRDKSKPRFKEMTAEEAANVIEEEPEDKPWIKQPLAL